MFSVALEKSEFALEKCRPKCDEKGGGIKLDTLKLN